MDRVILQFLKTNNIYHEIINHEPIYTMQHSVTIPGLTLSQGVKSLLLKSNKKFILTVLPGDKRLDSKKIKNLIGSKNLRFATKEEVIEEMNCEVGSCYPFGNLLSLKMIVDKTLCRKRIISFTPGVHHKTIKMRWEDYKLLVKPDVRDITQ